MNHPIRLSVALAVATLLAAFRLEAQNVIITVPNQLGAFPWGPGVGQAYGQSFTVPTNATVLDSFSFTSLSQGGIGGFNYTTSLYAFNPGNGTSPGAALYVSGVQVLPNSGTAVDTITPNIHLTAGATYIVLVNADGLAQTNPFATAFMGANASGNAYTGGNLYFAITNGSGDPSTYTWNDYTIDSAFTAIFSAASTTFAAIPNLNASQRGTASSIDGASISSPNASFATVSAALMTLPVTDVAGALDELAPTKFHQFASSTAFNNATFDVADMDNYLDGERIGPNGTFVGGSGQVDTHNFVVQDANVDPGLQMIHSRMLAWNDLPGVISDVPGAVLGGIDMKEVKPQCTACTASSPWNVFLRGSVILAQGFSQADVPHFDGNTASVTAGADYRLSEHLLVGATMSYAHTDATLDNFGSSSTVDSYSPGFYASYADGGFFANFIGRYSYNSYTEQREIAFLGQHADGGTDGNEGLIDLDGGYLFHSGPWSYGPVAGLQYTHLTVNGYTEQNSDASLSVNEDQSDSLRSRLGGEVRYNTCGCGVTFSPHLTATWQHEFMDQSRGLTSSFNQFGGGSFTVRTDDPSRDSALVDLGLDAKVDRSITVFGDYVVQAGQDNYFGQSLQAGVRVNF